MKKNANRAALHNAVSSMVSSPVENKANGGDEGKEKQKLVQNGFDMLAGMGVDCSQVMGKLSNADIHHTTRTGFGEELVPTSVLLTESVYETIPQYETFLNQITSSFHGNDLPKTGERSIIGRPGLMQRGSEKTTAPFANLTPTNDIATARIPMNARQLVTRIDVSDWLSEFNVMGAAGFTDKIVDLVSQEVIRTEESVLINGDPTATATGNINSDDATPATTNSYLDYTGLRKLALDTAGASLDLGTLDTSDFRNMEKVLAAGRLWRPQDCFWLMDLQTDITVSDLSHFTNSDSRGLISTLEGDNPIRRIDGARIYAHQDVPLTEADGRVSAATPANNVKGGALLTYGPNIQWGRHGGVQMKLYDYGAQGYQLEIWEYFAYTIVQQLAGQTAPTSVYGFNITV